MFKRTRKNVSRKAPEKLWLKKSFNFVVPHSLEDCCSSIESLDQGVFSSHRAYLSSIDQKQMSFNVCRSAGRLGTAWAVGYLQETETQSTHIAGSAGIPAFDILFRGCILGVIGLIFGLDKYISDGLNAASLIGLFTALILLITYLSLIWTRWELVDDFRRLGKTTGY